MAGLGHCSSWVMFFENLGLSSFKSGSSSMGLPSLGTTASAKIQLQVWVGEEQQGAADQEVVEDDGRGCQEVRSHWYNRLERA